jgi:hypothetical protein
MSPPPKESAKSMKRHLEEKKRKIRTGLKNKKSVRPNRADAKKATPLAAVQTDQKFPEPINGKYELQLYYLIKAVNFFAAAHHQLPMLSFHQKPKFLLTVPKCREPKLKPKPFCHWHNNITDLYNFSYYKTHRFKLNKKQSSCQFKRK